MSLEWERRSRWHSVSKCGRWSVAAYQVPKRQAYRFMLYELTGKEPTQFRYRGTFDTASAAKAAAESEP